VIAGSLATSSHQYTSLRGRQRRPPERTLEVLGTGFLELKTKRGGAPSTGVTRSLTSRRNSGIKGENLWGWGTPIRSQTNSVKPTFQQIKSMTYASGGVTLRGRRAVLKRVEVGDLSERAVLKLPRNSSTYLAASWLGATRGLARRAAASHSVRVAQGGGCRLSHRLWPGPSRALGAHY